MAESPDKEAHDKLEKDALARLDAARKQKRKLEQDLREGYFFTAPHLERAFNSVMTSTQAPAPRPEQQGELMSGMAVEMSHDFAGYILDTFMPSNFPWCQRGPGIYTRKDDWEQVKEKVKADDGEILKAISASNFYPVAQQTFNPDLSLGMAAIWIDDDIPAAAPMCQAVALRELEVNIGPFGLLDDRFVCRGYLPSHLEAALGPEYYARVPKEVKNRPANDLKLISCVWGYWRMWEDRGAVRWRRVLLVDNKLIDDGVLDGDGSCPLIIGQWNPAPGLPWGWGPTLQCLPWLRVLDVKAEETYERAEMSMRPPFAYPDDGVMNFEDGIESGKAYPMGPGGGKDIKPLFFEGDHQLGFVTLQDLERFIKRMYYQDHPEQLGKTPPTAEQWLDELIKAQRRIGPVGQWFWMQFSVGVFNRFRFLLETKGLIEKFTANEKQVAMTPYNPAVKSQEAQEVQNSVRFGQIGRALFPTTSQVAIDEYASMKNIKDKMGEQLIVLRSEDEVKKMLQMMAQAAMGGAEQPGGEGGGPAV